MHDAISSGHCGIKKTIYSVTRLFYWPNMVEFITSYIRSCRRCQISKAVCLKHAGLLQPLEIPRRRWTHISCDFITDLPISTNKYDSIWVIVDRLTKMAHFIPTHKTVNAPRLCELFLLHIVRLHGFPLDIVSDRDVRFTSNTWQTFLKELKINPSMSTAFHPESDGQTERTNRTIMTMLRCYILTDETRWDLYLPVLELAYNSQYHESIKMSPFEALIGENPLRLGDPDLDGLATQVIDYKDMPKDFEMILNRVRNSINSAQIKYKKNADIGRRIESYSVGEEVYLSTSNLLLPGSNKFKQKYIGPYKIVEIRGPNKLSYKLDLPPTFGLVHDIFNISQLKKYLKPSKITDRNQDFIEKLKIGKHFEYEVSDIIAEQIDKKGDKHYLVNW